MKIQSKIFALAFILLFVASILIQAEKNVYTPVNPLTDHILLDNRIKPVVFKDLPRFESAEDLVKAFDQLNNRNRGILEAVTIGATKSMSAPMALGSAETSIASDSSDFSTTNIQVKGVDEADIIKTDGDYIYLIANGKLKIVKAYPDAEVVSTVDLGNFHPTELFIQDNRLLVFGSTFERPEPVVCTNDIVGDNCHPYPNTWFTSAKLFDISDREEPELLKTLDFEGSYLTSRMIGDKVYFVINAYPRYGYDEPEEIIPLYREDSEDLEPIAEPTEIGYIEPTASNFIIIASISMDGEVVKETIVGSGQNVYASMDSLYLAQSKYGGSEKTVVTKFFLDDGEIRYVDSGSVKGRMLNQFSMDEYDGHFRIATTSSNMRQSMNNVYVLDEKMNLVGELEDLAPGERIYSVRFMGKKGYVVTFKKVDPLFVIDLEDHENPSVLGKLKIPGYSDYLHPIDENHLIGLGKDTVEAKESEMRGMDFAWYQGVKMAIFDVSDVENPIELHKVVIGDRGTDSEALKNHKAFLFDKEKNLLVLPITLAEIKGERTSDNQRGEFTFQGAYVYDVTLKNGFDLRGKISHHDNDDIYKKSGYYFSSENVIRRSLYIKDVLYTLSFRILQMNDLDSLERLNKIIF